ncbi:MAG: hypothetical protein ACXAE3_12485 [Candidatus Kariarchaeaceae archaeon]
MGFKSQIVKDYPHLTVPAGFKRYGHIMILRHQQVLDEELGHVILQLYSWCKSVYQHHDTEGMSRHPKLRLLAGEDNPFVVYKENGVLYDLDLSRITFSGGNRHLRERLAETVQDGEFLVDMFAAVGNLSMQPLVHREIDAILIEQDPYTFSHLQKTLDLNGKEISVALHLDCREFTQESIADRIFMGYHEIEQTHLRTALQIAKHVAVLHLHPIIHTNSINEGIENYVNQIRGLGATVTDIQNIKVKDYSPKLEHHELILQISK